MDELKDALQQARRHYPPSPDAFEHFSLERERKQKVRRVGTLVVALAIGCAALSVAIVDLPGGHDTPAASGNTGVPGVNGKIVFSHMVDDTWHLYTANPDGSDQTEVGVGGSATWSPDGSKLAVDRGRQGIFVTSADGSNAVKIADGNPIAPLTPLGEQQGFTSRAPGNTFPAWSPDGTKVLFTRWSNDQSVNYTSAQLNSFGTGGLAIASGSSHLFTVNADGIGETQLTFGRVADLAASWSRDGTQIVFTRAARGESGIYVMNADGSHIHQILAMSTIAQPPSWSPDGSQILFADETKETTPREGVYVMDADGPNVRLLTPAISYEDAPAWSPNGTKIVFACGGICTMNADGSDLVRLTRAPTNPFDDFETPSWGTAPTTSPSP